jgi:hypothetical protein
VRRLIMIVLCLCGLSLLVVLLSHSRRRPAPVRGDRRPPVADPPERARRAAAGPPPPPPSLDPAEQVARSLQTMADLRASIIDGVSRQPLYRMAVERGVHQDMFVASKWDLLDSILRAEGLSPEQRDASPEAARRLRALADEAFSREQEERESSLEHYELYRRFWRSSSA